MKKRKAADAKMEGALAEEALENINKYLKQHPEECIRLWVQLSGRALAASSGEAASASAVASPAKPTPKKCARTSAKDDGGEPAASPANPTIPHSRRRIRDLSKDLVAQTLRFICPAIKATTLANMDKQDPLFYHKLICMAVQFRLDTKGFPREKDEFVEEVAERYRCIGHGILSTIPTHDADNFDWRSHGMYKLKIVDGAGVAVSHKCGLEAALPKSIVKPDEWHFEENWDELGAYLLNEDGVSTITVKSLFGKLEDWPRAMPCEEDEGEIGASGLQVGKASEDGSKKGSGSEGESAKTPQTQQEGKPRQRTSHKVVDAALLGK